MARKARNKRIYYGPPGKEKSLYWDVSVSRATKDVTINGATFHALKALAGTTIGCAISLMAADKSNAGAFPHAVYLASVSKNSAWIVDKRHKDGSPKHAIWYEHGYGWIVDCNDERKLKKLVEENPSLMEREFTFKVPRTQKNQRSTGGYTPRDQKGKSDRSKTFVPRGALARAVKAGLITRPAAKQLTAAAA